MPPLLGTVETRCVRQQSNVWPLPIEGVPAEAARILGFFALDLVGCCRGPIVWPRWRRGCETAISETDPPGGVFIAASLGQSVLWATGRVGLQ